MGYKIFISYKYKDGDVEGRNTIARDYVNKLESYFDSTSHIYKGESDNEDLSYLSEDAIWARLKDKMYDTSVTIVMISPNMRESYRNDRSQWIPWEVAYSLRETTRSDRTSHSNAMLAVVLPDRNGSYSYCLEETPYGKIIYHTQGFFKIIEDNMVNKKGPDGYKFPRCGQFHYQEGCSYIEAVRWCDFVENPNKYIDAAVERKEHIGDYKITKDV